MSRSPICFVLSLAACWTQQPEPVTPVETAAPPTAPRESEVSRPTPREPAPEPAPDPDPQARVVPGRPIKARVVMVRRVGQSSVFNIPVGAREGVAKDWDACFVDAQDGCLANGHLTIVRVVDGETTLRLYPAASTGPGPFTAGTVPFVKLSPP